jgi:hypothetical protein
MGSSLLSTAAFSRWSLAIPGDSADMVQSITETADFADIEGLDLEDWSTNNGRQR